ncbi:MAG: hypothetical protein H6673_04350 [Anaerolineales bacterium]|nr:hypothetical protein [Anaerolineales bacterium]
MSEELLRQVAGALKQGDRHKALQLLKAYIKANPRDVRGWWALAKLSDDAGIKQESLKRVLRLDPHHAEALEMQAMLDAQEFTFPSDFNDSAPEDPFQFYEDASANQFDPNVEGGSNYDFGTVAPITPAKSKGGGGQLEWAIGIGMVLIGLALIPVIAWYAYTYRNYGLFGLFGPDMTKVAKTQDVQINYPDDWVLRPADSRSVVASTKNAQRIADATSALNLNIRTQDIFDGTSDIAQQLGVVFDEEMAVFIMAAMTEENLDAIRYDTLINYASFQQYIDVQFQENQQQGNFDISAEGFKFKSDYDRQEQDIGGEPGVFTYQTMYLKVPKDYSLFFGGVQEFNMGVYVATAVHQGEEYIFMWIAYGKNADSQHRTVNRMLRTIEFLH